MTRRGFQRSIDRGRHAAEEHLPRLEDAYAAMIRSAGRHAASHLHAKAALTAAGDTPNWQPPPEDELLDEAALAATVDDKLRRAHEAAVKASAGPALERAGISWNVTHPLVQQLLAASAMRTGARLGEAVQPVLRATIAEAYADGLSVVDAAALIRERITDASVWQSKMLARTDLNSLSNGGSVVAARMAGVETKTWLTAEDDRVREEHVEADGQTVPVDQPFDVCGEQLMYPGDPDGSDECVINCFPADTAVEFPGLRGVTRRWYDGDLVEVHLATGDVLSGTPNHPVLRADGRWTALREIAEGDDLVRASFGRDDVRTPDPDCPPATIGEVYRLAERSAEADRVRLAPPDFHGDGRDGEVDVVAVNGSLLVDSEAASDEEVAHLGFALADKARAALGDPGHLALARLEAAAALASRGVGGRGEIAPLLLAHPGEAQGIRFRRGTNRQPEFNESADDHRATDREVSGHRLHALPAVVALAQVVEVNVRAFHGEVFNLDTGAGYYIANGVACQNCRCTVIYDQEDGAVTAAATVERRAPGTVAFVSDIAFEGAATEDGRYILPGALDWRELPLTLMAMTETGPGGHEGAYEAGKMERIEKDDTTDMDGDPLAEGVTAVRSFGIFDTGGEGGTEVARLVAGEFVRGVSVDLGVIEWALRDPDTGDLIDPNEISAEDTDRAYAGLLQFAIVEGVIMAATVCPTPAFADARIRVATSEESAVLVASGGRPIKFVLRQWAAVALADPVPMTASAAGLAPEKPPRAWFYTPEAAEPTPLTVTNEGRVYGHMALWESCHVGYPGSCVPPPRSPSGYRYFDLGEIECDDGERVAVGPLTLEGLHARTDRPLQPEQVVAHYEDTAVVAAFVRAVDGKHGIWICGALRANLSAQHARDLMGAKPSGDWRPVKRGGPLEMLGVHAVNQPGFPVPRLVASALLPSGDRASLVFADEGDLPRRVMVAAARIVGGDDGVIDLI